MAKNSYVVAKRYAKALWLLDPDPKNAEKVLVPMKYLGQALRASKDLMELVKSASFSDGEKEAVVKDLLDKSEAPDSLRKYVSYLLVAKRLDLLPEIEQSFRTQVLKALGAVEAVVESAIPLKEEQFQQLTKQVEKLCGQRVILTLKENPEILAGLKIHVDGKTYDLSLKANMERIEKALLKTTAIAEA